MSRLQFLAEEYANSSQIRQNSLNYDEEKTLTNLKKKVKEKELIINKADKGNAAVITEKCEYIKKVEQLFSDTTKFKIIDEPDPHIIKKLEKSFNDNLHEITDENNKKKIKEKFSGPDRDPWSVATEFFSVSRPVVGRDPQENSGRDLDPVEFPNTRLFYS
jgi:hypothetical protein